MSDLQCETPVSLNRKAEFQNFLGLMLMNPIPHPASKIYSFIHKVSLIRCSIVHYQQWLKLPSNWIQETNLHPIFWECCSGEIRLSIKRAITTYMCLQIFWKSDKPISTDSALLKKSVEMECKEGNRIPSLIPEMM